MRVDLMNKFLIKNCYTDQDGTIELGMGEELKEESFIGLFLKLEENASKINNIHILEALMDIMTDVLSNVSMNPDPNDSNSGLNTQGLPMDFSRMLKSLGSALGYFRNSTSYRDRTLYKYDKNELINRINLAISQIHSE